MILFGRLKSVLNGRRIDEIYVWQFCTICSIVSWCRRSRCTRLQNSIAIKLYVFTLCVKWARLPVLITHYFLWGYVIQKIYWVYFSYLDIIIIFKCLCYFSETHKFCEIFNLLFKCISKPIYRLFTNWFDKVFGDILKFQCRTRLFAWCISPIVVTSIQAWSCRCDARQQFHVINPLLPWSTESFSSGS